MKYLSIRIILPKNYLTMKALKNVGCGCGWVGEDIHGSV
jgi:hypothetical protein